MAESTRLTIPAVMGEIKQACEFVMRAARHAGLDEHAAYECELAIDEVCTNIIEHGYEFNGEAQKIDIICEQVDERFTMVILDDSPAFNPLLGPEPDPDTSLEDRKTGGWGVYFIKRLMDEISYQQEDGRNRLLMVKHLQPLNAERAPRAKISNHIASFEMGNGVCVVSLIGRLDSDFSLWATEALSPHIHEGQRLLIVDMSGVNFITSNGIKVLVVAYKQMRALGGNMVLAAISNRVSDVFAIVGLDTVFVTYRSLAEAIATTTTAVKPTS
ncbi:MAG: anti-sigma factor antagonist [Burkholderiales bacterium]|nr:anti-sigma factor antagonist [Anaerolineae bacterium]